MTYGLDRLAVQIGHRSYQHYLSSSHWKNFRKKYRESDRPQKCIVCGSPNFILHHKTYDNLGNEFPCVNHAIIRSMGTTVLFLIVAKREKEFGQ
jgi:hypothetical protein